MSVWESVQSLKDYTFHTAHKELLKDRKQWFHPSKQASYVLWWIPVGHIPTINEAKEKLAHLQSNGSTPQAFDFKITFDPPKK